MNDLSRAFPIVFFFLVIGWVIENLIFLLIVLFVMVIMVFVFPSSKSSKKSGSTTCRINSVGNIEPSLEDFKMELDTHKGAVKKTYSQKFDAVGLESSISSIIKDIQGNGALIIDKPWIDLILSEKKVWEMRTTTFTKLGYIALVQKGSKTITGIARIDGYTSPLSVEELKLNKPKHQIPEKLFMASEYKWFVAMKLSNVIRLTSPIPYHHKNGSVIWVKLSEQGDVLLQLQEQLSKLVKSSSSRNAPVKSRLKPSDEIHGVTESKIWLRTLIKSKKVSVKQKGKWPICAKGIMFSAERSRKDGLYHLKRGNQQYRFESHRDALGALRRDEEMEWAFFSKTNKLVWKKTNSWEENCPQEVEL